MHFWNKQKVVVKSLGRGWRAYSVGMSLCWRRLGPGSQAFITSLRIAFIGRLHESVFLYAISTDFINYSNAVPLATHSMSAEDIISKVDWDHLV